MYRATMPAQPRVAYPGLKLKSTIVASNRALAFVASGKQSD